MKWLQRPVLCVISWLLAGVLAATLFVSEMAYGAKKTPVSVHGALKVNGTKLVDKNGDSYRLKGVSTHGLSWYPEYVNKEAFRTMRDEWGVNCVRLAMYTADYNGYCVGGDENKKELIKKVEEGVSYATELGMYVVIDWHILSDGNPNTYKKKAVSFFKRMAKNYKDQDNVIYEICNEPNGGTSWKEIQSYAKTVIKTIRKQDKDAVIIVGTPTWSQDVDVVSESPITGYENLMYAFHFYAGTHQASYRKKVTDAINNGLPVFVSEFGITDASGNGSVNTKEGTTWYQFLKKNGISCVAWNLSNKNEPCALLKSSCKKTSGWKRSDLSASGKWVVKMYGGSLR
ncbi:MAG: glycoside hydrolase family 5 protein [Clostridiales bacterium]|nr:glycoside hydrolase family 5 protein [Clostridiales bacterium]